MYQKTYGSNDNNDQDDEDYESGLVVDVSSGDEDYSDAIDNKDGKNNDDDYKLHQPQVYQWSSETRREQHD